MNTDLTVTDPLVNQEVTIIITLTTSDQPRDQRPAMISVGVPEQLPIIKSGTFGEMSALIYEAWTAFGVRAQVADTSEVEALIEAQVVATASIEDAPEATVQVKRATPKPQAKNLSLF